MSNENRKNELRNDVSKVIFLIICPWTPAYFIFNLRFRIYAKIPTWNWILRSEFGNLDPKMNKSIVQLFKSELVTVFLFKPFQKSRKGPGKPLPLLISFVSMTAFLCITNEVSLSKARMGRKGSETVVLR